MENLSTRFLDQKMIHQYLGKPPNVREERQTTHEKRASSSCLDLDMLLQAQQSTGAGDPLSKYQDPPVRDGVIQVYIWITMLISGRIM